MVPAKMLREHIVHLGAALHFFTHVSVGVTIIRIGEDPFLNGEYAMRWIHAFQYGYDGAATQYKAMPSAKHAFDYDLENWGGLDRASFNAIVSERDQVEYYFPAWRAAVEGGRVGCVTWP